MRLLNLFIFSTIFGDVINFDADRWLEDYNYRNKTSEYYNIAKNALNINHPSMTIQALTFIP